MTAQPADRIPASGPDTGLYEVIHLGGQAAVVVPVSDFLRLQALEQAASPQELARVSDDHAPCHGVLTAGKGFSGSLAPMT